MRKSIEWLVLGLFIAGFGYMLYDGLFRSYYNLSLLNEDGIETKGFVNDVGGGEGCCLVYVFNVDGKPYHGSFDCYYGKLGDTIDVVYLKENPAVNAKKEDLKSYPLGTRILHNGK